MSEQQVHALDRASGPATAPAVSGPAPGPQAGEPQTSNPDPPTKPAPETDAWKIVGKWILENVPPPLGFALLLGVAVLTLALIGIDKQFEDFDLLYTVTSFYFSLIVALAAAGWLVCAVLARKSLTRWRLAGFVVVFLLIAAIAAGNCVGMSSYEWNSKGLYTRTKWLLSQPPNKSQPHEFEWRFEAVKSSSPILHVKMLTGSRCAFTRFHPIYDAADKKRRTWGWKAEGGVDLSDPQSSEWDIVSLTRGGVVVFLLIPKDPSTQPADCGLPQITFPREGGMK